MKIVCISDTHNKHRMMDIPNGDILIHAGDISSKGEKAQITDFIDWFISLPHKHKVFIAGNHDITFDKNKNNGINYDWLIDILSNLPENIHYLENESIEIGGLKIFGSPITPWFHGEYWAFNKYRGNDIESVWNNIPVDVDILVTHGPPFGILDYANFSSKNVGCEDLWNKINIIKPKIHIFGHIHEGYGMIYRGETIFINASQLDENYYYINNAIEIEL
jgi:Icc-related predicted phosphoesterase